MKNGNTTNAGATFTGVAQRDGRTLLVTVMNPEPRAQQVYREAAALLDWGFTAAATVEAGRHTGAAAQPGAAAASGAPAGAPNQRVGRPRRRPRSTGADGARTGKWTARASPPARGRCSAAVGHPAARAAGPASAGSAASDPRRRAAVAAPGTSGTGPRSAWAGSRRGRRRASARCGLRHGRLRAGAASSAGPGYASGRRLRRLGGSAAAGPCAWRGVAVQAAQ